jgi:hypothetical protein
MKIKDETSDALDIIHDLHREMKVVRSLIDELEYVVYRCDDRCKIEFFGRGKNDEGRGKKGIKTY